MARPTLGYTELIQFRITKDQKRALEKYAREQHITLAELARQQLRSLVANIAGEREVAA
jgi:hypothetical protein